MSSTPTDPPWLASWKASPPVADPLRAPAGTFAPGVSGNPAGMPKGTKHTRTKLAEALKESGAALLQVAIDKALSGDASALTLCLSRLVPVVKPTAEPTPFKLDVTLPLADQAAQVAQAVADGNLSAEAAVQVLTCLDRVASLRQADTLEARLQALERANRARGAQSGIVYEDPES